MRSGKVMGTVGLFAIVLCLATAVHSRQGRSGGPRGGPLSRLPISFVLRDGNGNIVGDVIDVHQYPGPVAPPNEPHRAAVLGEYGGLGLPVPGHTWLNEANWGYRLFESDAALNTAYFDLIDKLVPLVDAGLSAAVYTQTSDVEIEVNGFMTYDREVVKLERARAAAAAERLYDR